MAVDSSEKKVKGVFVALAQTPVGSLARLALLDSRDSL